MAILKCKMCGGDVELAPDKTFGTCEYCGSSMTFPRIDSDERAAMFNRGNQFRRAGEFDQALAVYERIVAEDDADAEAHWCCARPKSKSISPRTAPADARRRRTRSRKAHIRTTKIGQQAAKPRAGGGSGRPAIFSTTPPMSALAAWSVTLASLSATIMTLFAPLCGSI